jgi:hypothetical protein
MDEDISLAPTGAPLTDLLPAIKHEATRHGHVVPSLAARLRQRCATAGNAIHLVAVISGARTTPI